MAAGLTGQRRLDTVGRRCLRCTASFRAKHARTCRAVANSSLKAPPLAQLGLVGEERAASFRQRRQEIEDAEQLLDAIQLSTTGWARQGFQVGGIN